MVSALLENLERLATHLPFHLNDIDQVNDTFMQWRTHRGDKDRKIVDVWTYCFVRRYFIVKFATRPHLLVADLDILVEQAYKSIEAHQEDLIDERRYASWVSVICKNTYLNFCRQQPMFTSMDQEKGPVLEADVVPPAHDVGIVAEGLRRAIDRLPDFARDIARLRLLENKSYLEIEQYTGKPLATVRTYYHRAIVKIRSDAAFLAFIGWSDPE